MDYKSVLKIGFKVLVAAATGLAIYVGIDRISESSNDNRKKKRNQGNNSIEDIDCNITGEPEKEDEEGFVQKLRNIQGTFSKLLAFAQSITLVADSFRRIFSGPNDSGYYVGQSYYYDNPLYNSGRNERVYINRLSPYVMEVVDDRNYRGI